MILLSKHFGACRFVYNKFLNEKTSLNYNDNTKSLTDLKKEENFNWLNEVNAQSLQQSLRNLDSSYKRLFT